MSYYNWQRLVFHAASFLGLDSAGQDQVLSGKNGSASEPDPGMARDATCQAR